MAKFCHFLSHWHDILSFRFLLQREATKNERASETSILSRELLSYLSRTHTRTHTHIRTRTSTQSIHPNTVTHTHTFQPARRHPRTRARTPAHALALTVIQTYAHSLTWAHLPPSRPQHLHFYRRSISLLLSRPPFNSLSLSHSLFLSLSLSSFLTLSLSYPCPFKGRIGRENFHLLKKIWHKQSPSIEAQNRCLVKKFLQKAIPDPSINLISSLVYCGFEFIL